MENEQNKNLFKKIFSVKVEDLIPPKKSHYTITEAAPLVSEELDQMNFYFFLKKIGVMHNNGFPKKAFRDDKLVFGRKIENNNYETLLTDKGIAYFAERWRTKPNDWGR